MSKFRFVGYQEQVEIPEGFEKLELNAEVFCGKNDPYIFVSQPLEISKWFYPITSLDARPSGKITFLDTSIEGICSAAELGKSITLISPQFGELSAMVNEKYLQLSYRILTDDLAAKKSVFESQINSLKELVK